jgi:hypothetical protein
MPIYRNLNEKVSYFNTISTFTNGLDSYASGNMFESLATTNPEAFNDAKLEAILNSKNLVNDFHEYFAAILNKDMDRYLAFIKEYANKTDEEFLDVFYKDYNVANYGIIQKDLEYLKKMVPDDQIMLVLFNTYIPDALSEEGIKKLIRVRLANNQILIKGLMKMMEANYDSFNISICEAQDLMKTLSDKEHSGEAIADIRAMFKDSKVLNNFKDKNGNYDFRPIGGAYLIMRDKLELQGAAPAKYLQNLFKYDCIVYSHGNVYEDERSGPIASSLTSKHSIIAQLAFIMVKMRDDEEFKSVIDNKLSIKVNNACNKILELNRKLFINMNDLNYVYDILKDLWNDMIKYTNNLDISKSVAQEIMYSWIRAIDYYLQPIYDKNNKMQNLKDGRSGRWTMQPVNTLTQKNITHVIDLLRTLKKEGFRNIMIMACNPGSVRLPIDIMRDKNFNVTMGLHSVLIENLIDNNDGMEYLNENLIDTLKQAFRDVSKAINKLTAKCRNRFESIRKDISTILDKKFKNTKFKPVKVSTIKIDGDKSSYVEVKCSNPDQLKKAVLDSNESIMRMIDSISDNERKYIDIVTSKYNLDRSIFESVEFI